MIKSSEITETMVMDTAPGTMTRSRSRNIPKPPEPESESDDESWDDRSTVTRPGPRLQQPNVYVNANLNKVKMEVDYNPIIAPPKEEVKIEDENEESGQDNSSTDAIIDCETGFNCRVKGEPMSDPDDQEDSSGSEPPKKREKSSDSASAAKVVEQSGEQQDNNTVASSSSSSSPPGITALENSKTLPSNFNSLPSSELQTGTEGQQQERNLVEDKKILEKTFSSINDDSLTLTLEPREAAKLWNIIEAEELLVAKYFVGFSWDFEDRRETRKKRNDNSINELEAFLSVKPNIVPVIPKIKIGDPRDVKLWVSLGVLGQVTSLKLRIIHFDLDFFTSLIQMLPNLKYLYLPEYSKTQSIKSHTLKVLTSVNSSVWESRGPRPLVLPSITSLPSSLNQLDQLEKLADCPKIVVEEARLGLSYKLTGTKLFEECKPRVAHIMSKFLSNSQNTLKILNLESCEMYLHLLEFPCLPGVTWMGWCFYRDPGSPPPYGYSPSLQLSKKFPNLHSIFLKYNCESRPDSWRKCGDGPGANFFVTLFKNMGAAPSVKNLTYFDSYQDFAIDPLFQVFPNIVNFEALSFSNTPDWTGKFDPSSESKFHSIWTLGKNLKKLDISVNVVEPLVRGLDSFFTGFSEETVEMLTERRKSPSYTPEELQQLRVKPCILELTDLQILTIHVSGRPWFLPRLLAVTGKYAFKYMPKNARIVIKVQRYPQRLKAGLKEVSRFRNVVIDVQDSLEHKFLNRECDIFWHSMV